MEDEKLMKQKIKPLVEKILCGQYFDEKGEDFLKTLDGRKISISICSSGQQETLPLVVILSTVPFLQTIGRGQTIYIEEPEAHIFPTAQKHIVELIATVFNSKSDGLQFFITTHSPYILTATNKRITRKENQSQIIIENPNQFKVCVVQVDGCAIQAGLRCDYLVIPDQQDIKKVIEIYIELKGSKISHAIEQLEATIKKLSDDPVKQEKVCIIISTRCPLTTPEIQNFKKDFKNKYNAKLEFKNRTYTYCLSKHDDS